MKRVIIVAIISICWNAKSGAQDVIQPPPPDTATHIATPVNKLPLSEIDIPIRMSLKGIYEFANRYMDTLFTSPRYPNDWVMDGCSVRYQYRFVRGPLQFKTINNLVYVSFSGYYGIRGSTRVCTSVGNSPWTPSCSCGFGTEKPRRIDAGFVMQLKLLPNYRLGITVNRTNPVAVDKCSVCFFGKDVTQTVATQLKAELDASISAFKQQMEQFSLRPFLQIAWDSLQASYSIPGFGYLNVQPSALRLSQVVLSRDSLFVSVGLSARPELMPQVLYSPRQALPNTSDFQRRSGFRLFISQTLHYDSLSALANASIAGKEFSVGKGLLKKTVRIDSVKLQGGGAKMIVQVFVSKAAKGVFYLEGIPSWDATKQVLYFDQLDYHIQSKQLLLNSASYLMEGIIVQRLKQYTTFHFADQLYAMTGSIARQLNRPIYPGINSQGFINKFSIDKMEAGANGLQVQGAAEGQLSINIDAQQLLLRFL